MAPSTSGVGPDDLAAYDEALELWRGEALSDFATEPWATAEAVRLAGLRLAALTERAQIAFALGRHQEVVGELAPLVAADPTLESFAGLLMVALYRSCRQADALDVYARTRDPSTGRSVSNPRPHCAPSTNVCCARISWALDPTRHHRRAGDTQSSPRPVPACQRWDASRGGLDQLARVARPLIGRDQARRDYRAHQRLAAGDADRARRRGQDLMALAAVVRVADAYPDGAYGVRLSVVSAPATRFRSRWPTPSGFRSTAPPATATCDERLLTST